MSIESVRNFFKERNKEDPVFELEDSGATVELANAEWIDVCQG